MAALWTGAGVSEGARRHRAGGSHTTGSQVAGIPPGALDARVPQEAPRTLAVPTPTQSSLSTGTGVAGVLIAASVRVPQQLRGTGAGWSVSDSAAGGVLSTHPGLGARVTTGGLTAGLSAGTLGVLVTSICRKLALRLVTADSLTRLVTNQVSQTDSELFVQLTGGLQLGPGVLDVEEAGAL